MIRRSAILLLAACPLFVDSSTTIAQEQRPIILAHRGGSYEFEENTMEAFRSSYEKGIRGFETDVRMTKDGALVILHDDALDRTYNAKGAVEEMSAAELKNVTGKKGQKLLFLDEFLDYFADKPGCYIELEMKTSNKTLYPDGRIEPYCQTLYKAAQARKPESSTYIYTSFDERPLKAVHALDPKAPMSLIAGKPCSAEFIQKAKAVGADRIACQLKGTSRTDVEDAHKQGLKVNGWPGHAVNDYYLAIGLGLDVHCTDIPTAIQKVKQQLP
ncbi:glycerophosphodiester phosphodiesterase [Paludisphaera rhizosphaerae]|uniref:glycerophosphodiester phosphodiesterase n=1 Tax=Paludisphaera rhizosphaerae TaxID=2711216 RepID=UPI0013EABC8D|nr:glycerophosphodiester phosphodiesterase [Paludisphaera rhizosphaerae]